MDEDLRHRYAERMIKLDRMLANLQAHIDQRAEEIAQPLIDEARKAADAEIERAHDRQQRAEDLVTELRRQLAAREGYNQRYQGRAAAIRAIAGQAAAAVYTGGPGDSMLPPEAVLGRRILAVLDHSQETDRG